MRRLQAVVLVAFGALALGGYARADDGSVCKDENSPTESAIEACTRVIKASKNKGTDLAATYYNRAISYRQKNDTDAALSDYNESIRLNPKYPRAFNNRAGIWKDKGDLERASPTTARRSARCEICPRLRQPGRHP